MSDLKEVVNVWCAVVAVNEDGCMRHLYRVRIETCDITDAVHVSGDTSKHAFNRIPSPQTRPHRVWLFGGLAAVQLLCI